MNSPQPGYLEQRQRQWPSPNWSHQETARLSRALPQLSPSHLSFPQGLASELRQAPQKYVIFFFLYCTDVLIQAECGRLLDLSWIKLLFAEISCTCCVLSYSPQIFLSQRVKSQKLCKGCYLWQVCLCSVKNTCNTPGWRTIAQITLVRGGSTGCINGGLRIRSGFWILRLIFSFFLVF